MSGGEREKVTLGLWLHREERDAWLCSLGGVGAGTYLPKSAIALEAGHQVPMLGPVGPVAVTLPRWLAEDRKLIAQKSADQAELF